MHHRTATRLVSAAVVAAALSLSACGGRAEAEAPPERYELSAPLTEATVPVTVPQRTWRDTLFEPSWDLPLPGPVHTSWISPNAPDILFVQQAEGDYSIRGIDTMSGLTVLTTPPLPQRLALPPYVLRFEVREAQEGRPASVRVERRLFAISDDRLYCFDVDGGVKIWEHRLDFSPSTGPLAQGTDGALRVFVGDWTGRVQVITRHPEKGFTYQAWQYNLGGAFSAQPLAYQDQVYVGDHAGNFSCYKLDREQAWKTHLGGAVHGGAVVRDRVLYAGNEDNILFALNRLSGDVLSQFNFNGPIRRAPFTASTERERVYAWVTSADPAVGGLYALRAQPDRIPFADPNRTPIETVRFGDAPEWFAPGAQRLVCSTPEHLFVTAGGTLAYALNRKTGRYDWSVDLAELHTASPLAHVTEYQDPTDGNRSFFTVDRAGHLVAYRLSGYRATTATDAQRQRAEELVRVGREAQRAPAPTPAPANP